MNEQSLDQQASPFYFSFRQDPYSIKLEENRDWWIEIDKFQFKYICFGLEN